MIYENIILRNIINTAVFYVHLQKLERGRHKASSVKDKIESLASSDTYGQR